MAGCTERFAAVSRRRPTPRLGVSNSHRAGAVTVYGRESEQIRVDGQTEHGNQRMGFFTHELRNLVNTAIVAFGVLKTGNVGVGGSTGAVLDRSLTNLRDLIARSLDEVRLTAGVQNREQVSVADFIGTLTDAATLEARARDRTLTVSPWRLD